MAAEIEGRSAIGGRRRGFAGDLIAIDDVSADGTVVRGDGALVRYLRLASLNPWVMDEQECDRVIRGLGRTLNRLPAQASVQFVAEAQPLRLVDLQERTRARTRAAIVACARDPQDAYWMARLQMAREETLAMHASEDGAVTYSYTIVVPYRPPGPALSLRDRPRTVRAHERAVRELRARCDMLRGELHAQGISSHELDGAQALGLLWAAANPTLAARDGIPDERVRELAAGGAGQPRGKDEARRRAEELRRFVAASGWDESRSRTLRVGDDQLLTIALSRKPEAVTIGWMLPAMQVGKPFRFVVHITALDARKEAKRLRREFRLNWGAQQAARSKGRATDFENQGLAEELAAINRRLANGRVGFFDVSCYLQLREPGPAGDEEGLVLAAQRARDDLTTATNCEVTLGEDHQLPLARSVLPLAENVAARSVLGGSVKGLTGRYTSDQVGAMVPVLGADCGAPDGIPLFFGAGRSLLNFDPLDPEALNFLITIVGAQGSGKTMLVQALLQALLAWGARGYIIDRADHYRPLVLLVGGAHFMLGAGANRHRICPWDVPDPARVLDEHIEYLIGLHAAVIGRRDRSEPLESIEEGLLDSSIRENYRRSAENPGHRGRELGLRRILEARAVEDRQTGAGERAAIAENLAARLEQYVEGGSRAWVLDDETTLPARGVPLVLFDTREVPEPLQGAVSLILTRYIAQKAEERHRGKASQRAEELKRRFAAAGLATGWVDWLFTTFVAYDECWSQMESEATGRRFNDVGRRSRHLGLVMMCATQRLQDFDTRSGRALLSSAERQFFLSQRPRDYVFLSELAGLSPHEVELVRLHVSTNVGRESRCYMINGSRGRGVVSLRLGRTAYWIATSHPAERPLRERAFAEISADSLQAHWDALDGMLGRPAAAGA